MRGVSAKESQVQFDYYYGSEADQFTFIKIPKVLISNKKRYRISSDAILLYGILLDRMQLSIKNRWIDAENRVYIIYRIAEIMEDFECSNKTAGQILGELNDIGLIEKVRRGQGKPDLIYVKNFIQKEDLSYLASETDESDAMENKTEASQIVDFTDIFQKCRNYTSRNEESTLPEMKNLHFKECKNYTQNKTDINNTKYINTDLIYPSISIAEERDGPPESGTEEGMSVVDTYRRLIRHNLSYDFYMQHGDEITKSLLPDCYRLICDVVCVPRKTVEIGGVRYPYAMVRERFLQLRYEHIEYVMDCMAKSALPISNIRLYLLAALYNAPTSMNHYYMQEVRQDMLG